MCNGKTLKGSNPPVFTLDNIQNLGEVESVELTQTNPPASASLRKPGTSSNLLLGRYRVGSTIGEGAQGKVKVAKDVYANQEVAIKFVSKSSRLAYKHSLLEAEHMRHIPPHPHICNLLDSGNVNNSFVMVMELGTRDLFSVLEEHTFVKMEDTKRIIYELLLALRHSHKHGVAHRDVKPENVLLHGSSDPSSGKVKLCDYGLAKSIRSSDVMSSICGSEAYIAPEMQNGKPYHGFAVDVFCSGIVLYNIATSFAPWGASVPTDIVFKCFSQSKPDFWAWSRQHSPQTLDEHFESLFNGMCHPNPARRFTVEQCLQHPFFHSVKP